MRQWNLIRWRFGENLCQKYKVHDFLICRDTTIFSVRDIKFTHTVIINNFFFVSVRIWDVFYLFASFLGK